jgi:hypothetical protein
MALPIDSPNSLGDYGFLISGNIQELRRGAQSGNGDCSPVSKLDGSLQFFLTGFSDPRSQLFPFSFGGSLVRVRLFFWEFDVKWLRFSVGRKAWSPSAHGNKVHTKFEKRNRVCTKFIKITNLALLSPTMITNGGDVLFGTVVAFYMCHQR